MWKRVKRIGLLLMIGSVVLGAGALVVVQTGAFQQWLLRRIEERARLAGYRVSAQRLDIDIWNLRGSLQGLSYDDGITTKITADRLSLDIPWSAFREDVLRITSVEADGVAVNIRSGEPAASSSPVEVPRIAFDRLAIRNASLTYSDPARNVQIPSFNILAESGRGTLTLASPVTISPDVRLSIPELAMQIGDQSLEFGPSEWRLDHPEVTVAGSSRGQLRWSPSPAINLDYSTNPFSYQNWRGLESSAKIVYENGGIKVTSFELRSGPGIASGSADLTGDAKSATAVWRGVNLSPAGLPATAEGNLQIQWRASDLSDVSGKGSVVINSRQYGRAESDVTIRNAGASLNVRADAMDSRIRGDIAIGFDRALSGTVHVTNARYGATRLDGTLGGTLTDPRLKGRLAATGITYNGTGPVNASANTSFRNGIVSLEDIQADLKNSRIPTGFLRIDLESGRLTGEIPEIRVEPVDFAPGVIGTASVAALINGTIEKPVVEFNGTSNDLNLGGTAVDALRFSGRLDANQFELTELNAGRGEGTLRAIGSYNFSTGAVSANAGVTNFKIDQMPDASATASLTTKLRGTIKAPIADFAGRLTDVRYQGQEHGDLDVTGTVQSDVASVRLQSGKYSSTAAAEIRLNEPYAYTASLTANGTRIAYQQYDFTAAGSIQASGDLMPLTADRIRFDDFKLNAAGVNLTAAGAFPDGARVNATVDLSRLPITTVTATGEARLQAVVSGTLKQPRIEGSVETSNATLRTEGMTEAANIQAAVDFTRDEFFVRRLQAAFAGATANVTGRGTLQGKGNFQFRAEGIRPERLIKDQQVTGLLSVEGEVNVAEPTLERIAGSAKVTQLELIVANIPIQQVQPIEVRLENHVLTARNILLEGLNTRTAVTGDIDLNTRALNFNIEGTTDLKVVEAFVAGMNPAGQIRTNVAVRGTPENPDLEGFINLVNAQLQVADPPVSLSDTNAQIQVRGNRIEITSAGGMINGGAFTASGGAEISAAGLGNVGLQLDLTGAQTEYPEGFQSEISSRLSLNGAGKDLEISGNVDILNGVYRRDIDLAQEVFSRIATASAQAGAARQAQPGMIDDIKLDVGVATPGFVSVANNLANFDMEGSFRLRGTIANPVITGRASVSEGGELYFGPQVGVASATDNARRDRYIISEGTIDFINPIRIEPNFNFVATREVPTTTQRYIITLHASGTPDDPKTELTSDPELDEPNIVALLLTGRILKDLEGSELLVAQEQAANYLSGRFGNLFQSAGSAFGIDTVRIDPVLVAGDEDLSAKLTIGKDITQNFNLVYSQNLSGARAQTWIANYQALQDLLIRGINLSDENKLTVELRHDLKWGGGPALTTAPKPKDQRTLGNISFEGSTVPVNELLKHVRKSGEAFSPYNLNDDVRNLRRFLADRDFLAANIRAVRNPRDGTVDIQFVINQGPSITFIFEGAKIPKAVQEDIRQIWIRGFAETASLRQSQDRLLRYLRDEGYLQARLVADDASPGPELRRFVFKIVPGLKFRSPQWVFKGIQPIDLNVTAGTVLAEPKAVQERIVNALWRDGFLNASSTEPRLVIDGNAARFEISVERGPRYTIGKITASDPETLRLLPPGEGGSQPAEGAFTAAWLEQARQSVVTKYWEDGFNDVQVVAAVDTPDSGTSVDVDFKIDAGARQVVRRIEINGNKTTDNSYILSQFTFKEGDPVDHVRLNLTRKKLYDTRLFKRVDLSVVEEGSGYVARTMLNEKPPWNFRYGFAVTDQLQTSDREFGATADFSYSNLLGKGITAGTSAKYTPDTREVRVFGSLPTFLRRNITTTGAVFRSRDLSTPESISDILGFTVQQQWKFREHYLLSYDYSYKQNHTFDRDFDPEDPFAFDLTIPIARFNGTVSRDTRDDILNATRGSFLSNSFEIAPPGVGSSIQFIKNYAQFFRFQPIRERLVWATAVRVGTADGFHGQELIPTEKFRAGGGTTLRAFQQDQLTDPGNGLLVFNQELRFPMWWRFSGVGFLDAGNVYSSMRSFNPSRLRYSPGAGIRILTPLVLVRFDVGWNVAPLAGENRYRFAFGVGQAF
jgi:outer membrane protein assembly factor BamA/autotransporter translocation and assembly factor TamB